MTVDPPGAATEKSGSSVGKTERREGAGWVLIGLFSAVAGLGFETVVGALDTPQALRLLAPATVLLGVLITARAGGPFHRERLRDARWKLWLGWTATVALVVTYLWLTTGASLEDGFWPTFLTTTCLTVAATVSLQTVLRPRPPLSITLLALAVLLGGVAALLFGVTFMLSEGGWPAGVTCLLFGVAGLLLGVTFLLGESWLFGVALLLFGVGCLLFGVTFLLGGGGWKLGGAALLGGVALLGFGVLSLLLGGIWLFTRELLLIGVALLLLGVTYLPGGVSGWLHNVATLVNVAVMLFARPFRLGDGSWRSGVAFLLLGVAVLPFGVSLLLGEGSRQFGVALLLLGVAVLLGGITFLLGDGGGTPARWIGRGLDYMRSPVRHEDDPAK